jgi:hypothetical protein
MRDPPAALTPRISPFPHPLVLILQYSEMARPFYWAMSGWSSRLVTDLAVKEGGGGARGRNGRRSNPLASMIAGLVKRQTRVKERIWDSAVR